MANKESENININFDIDTSEFMSEFDSEPEGLDLNFTLSSDTLAELAREFAGSNSHRGGRASKNGEVKVRKLTDEELKQVKEASSKFNNVRLTAKRNRLAEFEESHSITFSAKTVLNIASGCVDMLELASKLREKTGRYIPLAQVTEIARRALKGASTTIK